MIDIINSFLSWLKDIVVKAIDLLPDNPFTLDIPENVHTIIGYLNYFIPIGQMVTILTVWTSAILVFYVVSLLLRWIKAIE